MSHASPNCWAFLAGRTAGPVTVERVDLEFDLYLNALQTLLKIPKHFMSAICSLINSTSKLGRVDERVAKGTFPTLRLEPFHGLVDLACHI
ncbi:MAG: hypothetical protein DME62_15120 [Verrucomicrobia bacterium]|nr:MAG: hypothetical protein DME62_15120 [Verrucomicrobiota bacterium]